ncbi:MAG TPA: hypothetical protein VFG25_02720 [Nitrosopumilaceae archaeon]|nr:hypothetical protein [Nitrosopumilaceae archaeon]
MKPEPFGGEALEEFDPDYFIDNVVEVIENLNACKVFSCTDCGNTIVVEKNKETPKFCSLCGKQIEWGDLLAEQMDICPKCKKEYPADAKDYCEMDGSRLEKG